MMGLLVKIKLRRFPSGKVSGFSILWLKYDTYVNWTLGWKPGSYPKELPRFVTENRLYKQFQPDMYDPRRKWWHGGGLMLVTTRIEWKTRIATVDDATVES